MQVSRTFVAALSVKASLLCRAIRDGAISFQLAGLCKGGDVLRPVYWYLFTAIVFVWVTDDEVSVADVYFSLRERKFFNELAMLAGFTASLADRAEDDKKLTHSLTHSLPLYVV